MMKTLEITILLASTIFLASCLKEETPPKPIVDYGGITSYYIVNNSGYNLNVTYKIAPAAIDVDSTVSVPVDSTTEIFKYGGIGGQFLPSYVFGNLIFYNQSDNGNNNPLLTIEPVADDNWTNVTKKSDTVVKYELEITPDGL